MQRVHKLVCTIQDRDSCPGATQKTKICICHLLYAWIISGSFLFILLKFANFLSPYTQCRQNDSTFPHNCVGCRLLAWLTTLSIHSISEWGNCVDSVSIVFRETRFLNTYQRCLDSIWESFSPGWIYLHKSLWNHGMLLSLLLSPSRERAHPTRTCCRKWLWALHLSVDPGGHLKNQIKLAT